MIVQERERFRRPAAYRDERVWRDREGRNRQGQFTGAYNRRAEICAQRFASVEDKRKGKNYSRMALFQSGEFVVERKCLGILALPLITLKDRKSTRLNSSHGYISYAVFCLKKKIAPRRHAQDGEGYVYLQAEALREHALRLLAPAALVERSPYVRVLVRARVDEDLKWLVAL